MSRNIYHTQAQRKRAIRKHDNDYKKRAYKAYTFRFHKIYDKDIIEKLDQQHNRNGYIKRLIRK